MKYIVPFEINNKIVFQDYRKEYNNRRDWYYKHYQKTKHWSNLRSKALVFYNYECYICDKKYRLQLHHINYENLGKEVIGKDVIILCWSCHQRIHKSKKNYNIKQVNELSQQNIFVPPEKSIIYCYNPENEYIAWIDLEKIRNILPEEHRIVWDDALLSMHPQPKSGRHTKDHGLTQQTYFNLKKTFKSIIRFYFEN
ncbi:MAG TPA: hypothetical protein ENH60_12295 [Pricia sp.]|nr:hypothetical protein [Pricia sp.]